MTKVVIIEDEFNAFEALKKMLPLVMKSVKIVGFSGYVNEAIEIIETEKPDIVFLDIELEDGTGFDILKGIKKIDFKVIFTTAYNQYAIKAFKFSAIDYILKPIDPEELKIAIEKTLSVIETEHEHLKLLDVLQQNLEKREERIVLKTTEDRYILSVNDIYRLEADGAYTVFFTKTTKIIVSKNIKFYEKILGEKFIRCHQSHLINSHHLIKLNKNDLAELSNGDLVSVSTRKKANIMSLLK